MIYLSIPAGMEFKKVPKMVGENEIIRDCFVDPEGKKPDIDLQAIVQESLRRNPGRRYVISTSEFTIYLRRPPATTDYFLPYTPNKNGKEATTITPVPVQGHTKVRAKPFVPVGQFWSDAVPLSEKQLEEVKEKRAEQRANRRKTGDSPNAN